MPNKHINACSNAHVQPCTGGYRLHPPKNRSLLNADNLTLLMKIFWYSTIAFCFVFNSWTAYVFIEHRILGGVA